jgi:hypothetical protein
VPNWSSTSGDLGIFVYQSLEPIVTSDAKLEGDAGRSGWSGAGWDSCIERFPHPISSLRLSESRALSRQMTGSLRFSTVLKNHFSSL